MKRINETLINSIYTRVTMICNSYMVTCYITLSVSKVSPYYIACDHVRITYHCHSRIYGIYQRFVYPFHLKAIASLYFLRFYLICPTCFHKWPRVCSTYVNTFQSFPHPIFITGFVTRVIRRVPLVQQNCWSFRSTWVTIDSF
jgi:hypothetical protein